MNEQLLGALRRWVARGEPFALATIVFAQGSVPRGVGALLAVDEDGSALGSVSGGCVDAEVYELCRLVLRTGCPTRRRFGSDPPEPFAPSLACGGAIEVAIRRVDPTMEADIVDELDGGAGRRPRMLIFGAVQFADTLATVGRFLGYRVTVCDARAVFGTRERVPDADEVVVRWPHEYLAGIAVDERDVVCVLTHDEKFDVPVLIEALRSRAGYVGAIGSRRTCARRVERLREAGIDDTRIARLRSPIGLDLGGPSPQEVALSIGAEIVAARYGGSGAPLRDTRGPMHRHGVTGIPGRDGRVASEMETPGPVPEPGVGAS